MSKNVLAFATSLIVGGTAMAHAGNDHVALQCADAAMCEVLRQALTETPALPQPLTISLVIESQSDHAMNAHLAWGGAREGRGESMSLSVMDTTMRPSMIERFLVDLVRHSDLPK